MLFLPLPTYCAKRIYSIHMCMLGIQWTNVRAELGFIRCYSIHVHTQNSARQNARAGFGFKPHSFAVSVHLF